MKYSLLVAIALVSGFAAPSGAQWLSPGSSAIQGDVRQIVPFATGTGARLYLGGSLTNAGTSSVAGVASFDGSTFDNVGGGLTLASGLPADVSLLAEVDYGLGPRLLASGTFQLAGSSGAAGLAVWDGFVWSPLGLGLGGGLARSALVFNDGTGSALYIVGSFTSVDGVAAQNIARFDGATWSPVGIGLGGDLNALAVYDDGTGAALYAGGTGVPGGSLQRWNGNAWTPVATPGTFFSVRALAVHNDGSGGALFVGGFLQQSGYVGVAKYGAAGWSPLNLIAGAAECLAIYDSGAGPELYAGGTNLTPLGGPTNQVLKWNGTSWTVPAGGIAGSVVLSLSPVDLGSGPQLYAGGTFTGAGANIVANIARFDGSSWSSLSPGPTNLAISAVASHDFGSGPRLLVAAGDRVYRRTGSQWAPLGPSFVYSGGTPARIATLKTVSVSGASALLVGGLFTTAGGTLLQSTAFWNGQAWAPIGQGLLPAVPPFPFQPPLTTVLDYAIHPDGTGTSLFAAGGMNAAAGSLQSLLRIARFDGSQWLPLGGGLSPGLSLLPDRATCLESYDDGSGPALFVGGTFTGATTTVGTPVSPAGSIARWRNNMWDTLGGGMNGAVFDMTVFDDGTGRALYACGTFTTAGGTPAQGVARWTGTGWTSVGTGPGFNPNRLIVFDDGGGIVLWALGAGSAAQWNGTQWISIVGLSIPQDACIHREVGIARLFAGGDLGLASATSSSLAEWSVGSTITVGASQATAGAPIWLTSANLIPGHPIRHFLSIEPCVTLGTGPFLGLCASTTFAQQLLFQQLLLPLGNPPFHFAPTTSHAVLGPYLLPVGSYDLISYDPLDQSVSAPVRIVAF